MNTEPSSTGAAYIRYGTSASVENVYVGGDDSSDVIVDLDEPGAVIGIEIVDVSIAEDVARARAFAIERALPFPAILRPPYVTCQRLERRRQLRKDETVGRSIRRSQIRL